MTDQEKLNQLFERINQLIEKGEFSRKAVSFVKGDADDDGGIPFRITELRVDRESEVVKPNGAVLKDYKDNPIVLFSHGYSSHGFIPIGRMDPKTFDITDQYFDSKIYFDDDGDDPFAKMIASKVKNKFLTKGSIGFRTITASSEPLLPKQRGRSILKWELMEYSIVPVPALTTSGRKGEWEDFKIQCKDFGHPIDERFMYETYGIVNDTHYGEIGDEKIGVSWELLKDYLGLSNTATKEQVLSELKEGRVLSGKNRKLISTAVGATKEAIEALEKLLEATNPEPEPTPEPEKDTPEIQSGSTSFLQDIRLENEIASLSMKLTETN